MENGKVTSPFCTDLVLVRISLSQGNAGTRRKKYHPLKKGGEMIAALVH